MTNFCLNDRFHERIFVFCGEGHPLGPKLKSSYHLFSVLWQTCKLALEAIFSCLDCLGWTSLIILSLGRYHPVCIAVAQGCAAHRRSSQLHWHTICVSNHRYQPTDFHARPSRFSRIDRKNENLDDQVTSPTSVHGRRGCTTPHLPFSRECKVRGTIVWQHDETMESRARI